MQAAAELRHRRRNSGGQDGLEFALAQVATFHSQGARWMLLPERSPVVIPSRSTTHELRRWIDRRLAAAASSAMSAYNVNSISWKAQYREFGW